ncbi:hypothetical protein RJ639_045997 [Escallonia herrerae]|uniref:Uncharacterized protein n=1 Tax=Escallonia herrerae TaxID=1293975 RepID=A0AA88W8P8_9ASTE|nr:hypothetical protein RJ639_045997 [Escallonia herrerae]
MDRLWFHHIILFPPPNSVLLLSSSLETSLPISSLLTSSNNSIPEEEEGEGEGEGEQEEVEEEVSVATLIISPPQDDSDKECREEGTHESLKRPTRLKAMAAMRRGHSLSSASSPTAQQSPKNFKYSSTVTRLQKSMSCKSLGELEVEEVKGFMDLGFIFDRENLSPRMMSVIPGLQRLGSFDEAEKDDEIEQEDDDAEEENRMRPYLSEAWLIKRPDSPLLNMRIPRGTAADMKKHLKSWARTVASEVQLAGEELKEGRYDILISSHGVGCIHDHLNHVVSHDKKMTQTRNKGSTRMKSLYVVIY